MCNITQERNIHIAARETEPQAGRLSMGNCWEVVEMKQITRFLALLIVLVVILLVTSH